MSDTRRPRDDPSQRRGLGESPGYYSHEVGKGKQPEVFVPLSKKIDGFGDSLVTTNMNDVKFNEEGMMEGASFIPSLADLNDNSELLELSFLNLHGVCQAEKDILHKIIHNSQWYSDSLFCFMRRTPSPSIPIVDDPSNPCLTEAGLEGDGILEVSGDPDNVSESIPEETGSQLQNGPVVDLSQQHINPVDDGSIGNVMSPGVPAASLRSYYSSQPHMVVSSTGPGQNIPPTSVQISVSGGQMAMYPQQMQQMMQPGHGAYSMPVGYPQLHYGYSQHGGQPHVTYVSPSGEAISPESVHIPQHQKGHHDTHHGMPHSSSSSGPGGYSKNKGYRRDMKQQQQQQQQSYYYPSYGYAPAGMQYHNHQQLAQNVTGSPIIMQAPGNMYPYHQHPHPSLYPQNTTVGSDMEHHQSGLGGISMSHMSPAGDIPAAFAQHHPVPHMYHHSPTHGTHAGGSRSMGGNYPASSSRNSGGNAIPPPLASVDHSSTSSGSYMEATTQPEEVVGVVGEKSSEVEFSQNRNEGLSADGISHEKKSLMVVTEPQSVGVLEDEATTVVYGDGGVGVASFPSQNEPLSEPIRDTVVDRIRSPTQTSSQEKISASKKGASSSSSSSTLVDSQTKAGTVTMDRIISAVSSSETVAVNGEVKENDIKATARNTTNPPSRDKLSAEQTARLSQSQQHDKPKMISGSSSSASVVSNSCNTRSVNVLSNTTNTTNIKDTKEVESSMISSGGGAGTGAGEFPQLSVSSNNSSTSVGSAAPPVNNNLNSVNTPPIAPTKGRSWASIASAKSQQTQQEGAINQKRVLDQGSGDSLAVSGRMNAGSGEQYHFVPSGQPMSDKDFPRGLGMEIGDPTDENDPVAIALGEFLRNYTLDHHSIALTPRGLCNQGNYCYINATLQSLLACPPFVNMFRAMGGILHRRACRATPIIQNVFELVTEFEPLLRGSANKKDRMKDGFIVGTNLEPLGIRKCLGLLEGSTFKVEGRQEDAEEFLSHLLNGLHDEMLKVMKWAEQRKERSSGRPAVSGNPPICPGATNGGGVEMSDEDDDQWQVMGARNKSCLTRKTAVSKTPVAEAFLGQMCYLFRESSTGSHKSMTLQPFYTLQLDIQNDNIRSVRDALEAISAREEVSGIVSANGSEVEAWRQLSLEDLPVVLILHLKRFVYEKNGNKIKKIDKKLDFGIDLEIGKEMLSASAKGKYLPRQRQYKLFGVVYHDGEEAHKGHYIADCFHASNGSMWGQCGWLRFDDTSVKQIPESQMLNQQPPRVPYLLYYRRGDTLLSHVTQQQQQLPHKGRP